MKLETAYYVVNGIIVDNIQYEGADGKVREFCHQLLRARNSRKGGEIIIKK